MQKTVSFTDSDLAAMEKLVDAEKCKLRNAAIEECAREVEKYAERKVAPSLMREVASAIRGLKDKRHEQDV